MEAVSSGTLAGAGSFRCDSCAALVALQELDRVPDCPECGGREFHRARLFEELGAGPDRHAVEGPPAWLAEARAQLVKGGHFVAYEFDGKRRVTALAEGWTRIGRSLSADVRLDDPTVSRRHALVYRDPDGSARVLDDRSLNGVFRNGTRVELAELEDGDEISIGRFSLFFLCLPGAGLRERSGEHAALTG